MIIQLIILDSIQQHISLNVTSYQWVFSELDQQEGSESLGFHQQQ
jgi:hypothetical protein